MRLRLAVLVLCLLVSLTAGATARAATRSCRPVINPYPGSRFSGIDLTHITAAGVSCRTARRVARRGHRKALGLGVPVSGVRVFQWHGWRVRGDIRPPSDRYVARRGAKRVRWRF